MDFQKSISIYKKRQAKSIIFAIIGIVIWLAIGVPIYLVAMFSTLDGGLYLSDGLMYISIFFVLGLGYLIPQIIMLINYFKMAKSIKKSNTHYSDLNKLKEEFTKLFASMFGIWLILFLVGSLYLLSQTV